MKKIATAVVVILLGLGVWKKLHDGQYEMGIINYYFGHFYSKPPQKCRVEDGEIYFAEYYNFYSKSDKKIVRFYSIEINGRGSLECECDQLGVPAVSEGRSVYTCEDEKEALMLDVDCGTYGTRPWKRTREQVRTQEGAGTDGEWKKTSDRKYLIYCGVKKSFFDKK